MNTGGYERVGILTALSAEADASPPAAAGRVSFFFKIRNLAGFFLNNRFTCVAECFDRCWEERPEWAGAVASGERWRPKVQGDLRLKMAATGRDNDMLRSVKEEDSSTGLFLRTGAAGVDGSAGACDRCKQGVETGWKPVSC